MKAPPGDTSMNIPYSSYPIYHRQGQRCGDSHLTPASLPKLTQQKMCYLPDRQCWERPTRVNEMPERHRKRLRYGLG